MSNPRFFSYPISTQLYEGQSGSIIATGISGVFLSTNTYTMQYSGVWLDLVSNVPGDNTPILTFDIESSNMPPAGTYPIRIYNETTATIIPNQSGPITVNAVEIRCFAHDTKILGKNAQTQQEEYMDVQSLKKGDLVKTHLHGYKQIVQIMHSLVYPYNVDSLEKNKMYQYMVSPNIPELFLNLTITGSHSVLVDEISNDERDKISDLMGNVFITDNKYRLPACLDMRAKPVHIPHDPIWVYHFALENECEYSNYGVFANGMLVESISQYDISSK